MRTLRLGRVFDAVLVHDDGISYMTTEPDLRAAIETAFVHTRPGGAAVFTPDDLEDTFARAPRLLDGDDGERSLRYLEWSWDPVPGDGAARTEYVLLMREGDEVRVVPRAPRDRAVRAGDVAPAAGRGAGFTVETSAGRSATARPTRCSCAAVNVHACRAVGEQELGEAIEDADGGGEIARRGVAASSASAAASTVPGRGTSRARPWRVRPSVTRRVSIGSRRRSTRPRASSRRTLADSVPGSTCRARASWPAVTPGKRPRKRSTRRCGAVTPIAFSIRRERRSRAWLVRHRHLQELERAADAKPRCRRGRSRTALRARRRTAGPRRRRRSATRCSSSASISCCWRR